MTSTEKKNCQRKFYKTLMTIAFFLDNSQYRYISRFIMQFYVFDWMVLVSNNNIILYHFKCLLIHNIFDIIKRFYTILYTERIYE